MTDDQTPRPTPVLDPEAAMRDAIGGLLSDSLRSTVSALTDRVMDDMLTASNRAFITGYGFGRAISARGLFSEILDDLDRIKHLGPAAAGLLAKYEALWAQVQPEVQS